MVDDINGLKAPEAPSTNKRLFITLGIILFLVCGSLALTQTKFYSRSKFFLATRLKFIFLDLSNLDLERFKLKNCELFQVDSNDSRLVDVEFHAADFYQVSLTRSDLTRAQLSQSRLRRLKMEGGSISETDF